MQTQQPGYPGPPPMYPQQQYYQGYPSYPPYPAPQQEARSGGSWFGPFIWIAIGAVLATIYTKVTSFMQNPQAAQARMMSWVSAAPLFKHRFVQYCNNRHCPD